MRILLMVSILSIQLSYVSVAQSNNTLSKASPQAKTVNGMLEGVTEPSGIRAFKGIPFAQPPVGALRWKEPQPAKNWTGVQKADKFGPRAMQLPIFGDMNFRSDGVSEDCLYLNVWTPAKSASEKLPVMVYFYGGGFVAGDGSEPRYDGENMAKKGIVTLTVNYRLGVFGFMAHPELTSESPHHASSNYGYLDQSAALRWVQQNIAAFGGDPARVTIAGESAGSASVSAQMMSPLSKDLIAGAIGESGSVLGTLPPSPLAKAEEQGVAFAKSVGANSLAELRAMPAQQLLDASGKQGLFRFTSAIDGYFFPKPPAEIMAAGEQAHVPLLVGWNSQEMGYQAMLGKENPTPENYAAAVKKLYGEKADDILKLYPATTSEEVEQAATDLASDRFIAFSTWRWADMQAKTGGDKPVYRYLYSRPRPAMTPEMGNATAGLAGGVVKGDASTPKAPPARGAVHSAEIEYALGNLATNKVYAWTPDDYKVSEITQAYFANFIKTGNPNGSGLPQWPALGKASEPVQFMHIDVNTQSEKEKNRARYLYLEKQ